MKNVLCDEPLSLTISFIDGTKSDSTWEGSTKKKISLAMGTEHIAQMRYVVVKPGIYNISNEIKYEISNNKS
jgi:hypothetical protein